MRNLGRLLIVILALSTATTVFYAFQQTKALRTARLTTEALEKERTELRKKLWEAERRQPRVTANSAANAEGGEPEMVEQNADGTVTVDPSRIPGADMRGGAGRMLALLDNPEAQRLLALQQRGALDQRYAALFKQLNLSPAQLEQLKTLMVEKRTAIGDVVGAARSEGLTGRENRDEIQKLIQQAQGEVDGQIRSLIGENKFSQLQAFEQTQPQRNVVGQLEQRLSYSSTPLTSYQSEQLVQVLAASSASSAASGGTTGGTQRRGNNNAPLTDQAIQQASTVLNQAQVQTLQQIQQEQLAQAQLSQLMRDQARPRRNAPGGK